MKVLLKRDFIIPDHPRFQGGVDLVEIPDGITLPADAVIIDEEKPTKRSRKMKEEEPVEE